MLTDVCSKKEILVNKEQEYIRKSKHSCEFEDYESKFEDTDFQDAKRWIIDTTISFYAKNEEEIINRIRFEFHNARIDTDPIIEGDYFYWFDNNCLVNCILHESTAALLRKTGR